MSREIVRWEPGENPVPIVQRANDMAVAAAEVRRRRETAILAVPLPEPELDEVLILIFHREFPSPRNRDVMKRYTYVATFRPEPRRWYITQDPNHRPVRPLDNREMLLFARPIGPPVKVAAATVHAGVIQVRTSTWFLPTQAAR